MNNEQLTPEFKYFPRDVVDRLLNPSTPAKEVVELLTTYVNDKINKLTPDEVRVMKAEAQVLNRIMQMGLKDAGAKDRQNKMHNIYLNYMAQEMKENILLLFTTCNNAAYYVMSDAIDLVRQMPEYNQKHSQLRRAFDKAEEEWRNYERAVKFSRYHFLDPKYFTAEQKKRFREDLTQDEYTEYWQCIGGKAFTKIVNEVNVLCNKFKLSVESHNIPNAKTCGYILATASMFVLCEAVRSRVNSVFSQRHSISMAEVMDMTSCFSLKRMEFAWGRCVRMMGPVTRLTEDESRNIELTVEQLVEHWNDASFFVSSEIETAEEFPEIFRTKGEQKKYLRELPGKYKPV